MPEDDEKVGEPEAADFRMNAISQMLRALPSDYAPLVLVCARIRELSPDEPAAPGGPEERQAKLDQVAVLIPSWLTAGDVAICAAQLSHRLAMMLIDKKKEDTDGGE